MNYLAWARLIPLWAWILAAAVCVIGVQQWRVAHYQSRAITLQSAALTFESAQKTNLATIGALRATVDDWARKCAANEQEARQQAQLSVEADRKSSARLDANIKTLRGTAEHDVSVKAWLEQPVPPSVVRVLAEGGGTD